jgi:hypothetical protein
MYTVAKDGVSVTADTEAELRIAIAVLNTPVGSLHLPVAVNAPAPSWRVGGPPDEKSYPVGDYGTSMVPRPNLDPYGVTADRLAELEEDAPVLSLVLTESSDSVAPQHIPVSRKNNEILEAIMLFTEGVGTSGLTQLLGIPQVIVASRIQALKSAGLVEKIPGHRLWRATQLARRAKLVVS